MKRNKAAFFILLFSCGLGFSQDPSVQTWQWLQDLGDDNPEKRETATLKLIEHFKTAELPVRQFQKETTDPEVKGRLNEVLREGPKDPRVRALEARLSSRVREIFPQIAQKAYANDMQSLEEILVHTAYHLAPRDRDFNCAYIEDTQVLRKAFLERFQENPKLWTRSDRFHRNLIFQTIIRAVENKEFEDKKLILLLKPFIDEPSKTDFRGSALEALVKIQPPEQSIQDAQAILERRESMDEYDQGVAVRMVRELKSKEQAPWVRALMKNPKAAWFLQYQCRKYFITVFPDTEEAAQAAVDMIAHHNRASDMMEGLDALAKSPFLPKYRGLIAETAYQNALDDLIRERAREILKSLDDNK